MARILVIDDDPMIAELIKKMSQRLGHEAETAGTLCEGLRSAETGDFDLVFLDIQLPDGSGLDSLPKIQSTPSSPEVVIVTAYSDADGAELAIRSGAWDYVEKPFTSSSLSLSLSRALQYREAKKKDRFPVAFVRNGIIGDSAAMKSCFELAVQAAACNLNILITGETGTGKELMARAIHLNSDRSAKNFVVVDCAALPENIVESVLFGHEKGAFTGADRSREGLVKQADGGVLFLDEIGDLPLNLQKAFLRVLQDRKFRAVGGSREISSDFRLIAATNRNLEEMEKEGKFRSDLLFRLRSIVIDLPPLRNRHGDIKDIAFHSLAKLCERHDMPMKSFSPDFFETMTTYDWPGNVRELIHAVERAFVAAQNEPTLFSKHLPPHIRVHMVRHSLRSARADEQQRPVKVGKFKDLRTMAMSRFEREYLSDLLELAGGNILQACQIAGLSRPRLYALLQKNRIRSGEPQNQNKFS